MTFVLEETSAELDAIGNKELEEDVTEGRGKFGGGLLEGEADTDINCCAPSTSASSL
jgi:hypothetical protein